MVELTDNNLVFRFPEVHESAVCRVNFQRTLRIPDDNREYPLPPGLGPFSMEHVEDHISRLPAPWADHGGVLLPMYQAEALWIRFSTNSDFRPRYPFAIKVAAGKINAITGEEWSNGLSPDPQDYLVIPGQPWLDGFCVRKGLIRQFVAMPLGDGYTAEEQITGKAENGGLQIIAYPMKRARYEEIAKRYGYHASHPPLFSLRHLEMGLAPGGLMRQEIYHDDYGFDAWEQSASSRCFVHILNSTQWSLATGKPMPGKPPSASDYAKAGLPWFDYLDNKLAPVEGAEKLAVLDSVAAKGVKLDDQPLSENDPVAPKNVVKIGYPSTQVKSGKW